MTSGANLVLSAFEKQGTKNIFGYPGGAIMPIYDALTDSKVKHYLCRHEQGAAFAAVGYARASGKVGVCMATSGPGATNLLTGLADAMLDSIPVVAITGQVPTNAMGGDAFQEVDILGLSLSITKHSFIVKNVNQLAEILDKAFEIASSGRPGPVLVDIPKDIQLAKVDPKLFSSNHGNKNNQASRVERDFSSESQELLHAKRLLHSSRKPIAYVGGGAGMADALDELDSFLTTTKMPSVVTLKGIGAVNPNHENYFGMLGMHGLKAANLAIQECDLLFVVGARFDDRVTGKLCEFAPNAKVIHLDIDPAEIGKRREVQASLTSCLKVTLKHLEQPLAIESWRKSCSDLISLHVFDYQAETNPKNKNINAPSLLNQLSLKMKHNSVVATDVGQHQMWAAQHMLFTNPKNFLSSGGLGTMGFGLPAAIGAQLSRPNDSVFVVCGDGSLMMNVQELATIKRFNLPIKILLLDNAKLGLVRQWQQLFFDKRYSETDLSDNPDFVALSSAFEITAESINSSYQVEDALNRLVNSDGAYLLHIQINPMDNVWPLVPPGVANHQMMENSK